MEKEYYTAEQIANWFLTRSPMSPKKLQKMLYYAYAWVLTLNNDDKNHLENRLFDNKFEAWVHGPVLPGIYHKFQKYGYHNIPVKNPDTKLNLSPDIEDILIQVERVYGKFNANQLESITHQEFPWKNAREGYNPIELCKNHIKDSDIFNCYIKRES